MANLPRMQLPHGLQGAYPDSSSSPLYPASYDTVYALNSLHAWTPHVPQESLSDDGLDPADSHHNLVLPWYETFQTNEVGTPGTPLSNMNPYFVVHPQGSSPALPGFNQRQEAVLYPIGFSPGMQTLAPTEPGPSLTPLATPPPAVQPVTQGHKYACGICPKTFDRPSRMENCRNRHSGARPHQCRGRCGTTGCTLRYGSVDYLKRHINPRNLCECGESITKQNMSRHRAACGAH